MTWRGGLRPISQLPTADGKWHIAGLSFARQNLNCLQQDLKLKDSSENIVTH
jgi:hypothetical protein